jgi:hypothetical protein
MLPNEVSYLVSLEQHRDRLRELERHQLIQLAGRQRPANRGIHRRVVAWIGGQLVRWGLALQGYGPRPQQPPRAAAGGRVR